MASSLGDLVARMILDTAQFTGPLNKAEQQLENLNNSVRKIGSDVTKNMMGVVAGFVSAQKAIETFNKAVQYSAGLDDLSDATGIAVKDLDQMTLAMKLAGVSSETFERALNALSKTVVEARDPTSKSAAVMKALGVDMKDAAGNALGMGVVFQNTLRQLAAIEDPALRAATAQATLGKSGKELNKMLQDQEEVARLAADQIDAYGAVSTKTATNAESFQRSMILLEDAFTRAAQPVIDALAPAMRDIIGAFASADKEGIQFAATLGTALATGFKIIAQVAYSTWGVLKQLGESIGAVAAAVVAIASGDFKGAVAIFDELEASAQRNEKSADAFAKRLWDADDAVKATTPSIKANTVATNALTHALNQGNDAAKKNAEAERAREKALRDAAKAAKETSELIAKLTKEANEEEDERLKKQQQGIQMAAKALQNAKEEADALTKTATERALDNLEKDRALALDRQLEPFQRRMINADYDAARALITKTGATKDATAAAEKLADAQKKAAEEQSRMIDDMASKGADWLMEIVNNGKDGFKNLWDSFKQWGLRALAEVAAKQILVSVMGVVGSNSGEIGDMLSQVFGGGKGGSGGLGGIGSFSNPYGSGFSLSGNTWGGTASGMGPPTADGGMSMTYGDYASGALGGAATGAAIGGVAAGMFGNERNSKNMETGAMIGGIIGSIWGPIGTIVGSMLGAAIGSLIKSGGGAKSGGYAATPGVMGERFFTPADQDAVVTGIVDATVDGYDKLIDAFGGKKSGIGFALGFDTDPKGTSGARLTAGVYKDGDLIYGSKDKGIGKTQEEIEAAIATETKRMLLVALQASDLPEGVSRILNTVLATTATAEQIDEVMGIAVAFADLNTVVESMADPLKSATDALEAAGRSSLESLNVQRDSLRELAATVPTTAEGIAQLTEATNEFYTAATQLLAGMLAAKKQITAALGNTAESFIMSTLDPDAQYARIQARTQGQMEELATATDPDRIVELTQAINQGLVEAWNLLSPEEKMAALPEFLQSLADLETASQARLDLAIEDLETTTQDDHTFMTTTLSSILDGIEAASTTFSDAANVIAAAAGNGISVNVTVNTDADVQVTGG